MAKDESQISRQARWQRKHRALGLCVLCSKPAFRGWRCRKHYEQHKITMRLRYIPKVRGRYNVGDLTPKPTRITKGAAARRRAAAAGRDVRATASAAAGTGAPLRADAARTPRSRAARTSARSAFAVAEPVKAAVRTRRIDASDGAAIS
ncbi:MAG: hypothetical protein ACKPBU_04095, partial [Alphaproteobacteria bacterium]